MDLTQNAVEENSVVSMGVTWLVLIQLLALKQSNGSHHQLLSDQSVQQDLQDMMDPLDHTEMLDH